MTECEEVARSMLCGAPRHASLDETRRYVRERMPGESEVIVDSVAYELARLSRAKAA